MIENPRPISSDLKANCNTINPTEQINDSYNVTRVKYQIKQNSQTNNGNVIGEEEKIAQNGRASRRNQNKVQRKKWWEEISTQDLKKMSGNTD